MEKFKLEVNRYSNDVISTSGLKGCPKMANMTKDSFEFDAIPCGWNLLESSFDPKGEQRGFIMDDFTYYNESGTEITVLAANRYTIDGMYFHFDGNGKFEICTNDKHHFAK